MYWDMGSRMAVPGVAGFDFSRGIPMGRDNSAKLIATVFSLNGGASGLDVDLEGSNNRQNWWNITSWTGLAEGTSTPPAATAIPYAFVRLKYTAAGGGVVLCASALCTEHL